MKKWMIWIIPVVVFLMLVAGIHIFFQRQDQQTHLVIGGEKYSQDSASVTLSGNLPEDWEKLQDLPQLTRLDLRKVPLTLQQYDQVRSLLPNCQIRWSVPFQDGFLEDDTETLELSSLSEADLHALPYLPNLRRVLASKCDDYEALMALKTQYPQLEVTYQVTIGGKSWDSAATQLQLSNADPAELLRNLSYLPSITCVKLTGRVPEITELLKLCEAFPEITWDAEIQFCGIKLNTLTTEFIDLSGIQLSDTAQLEAVLPLLPNLKLVDMVDCGISNTQMEALNQRYPNTKFVWTVQVGTMLVRTDIKYFVPASERKVIYSQDSYNLRYLTDLICLDLGHMNVKDLSFLYHMPDMQYLMLCETDVVDLSPIGSLTKLKFLEIFLSKATDLWPLVNCTCLEDLNLSYAPVDSQLVKNDFGGIGPLYQMTWLNRLWLSYWQISDSNKEVLRTSLPNTTIHFTTFYSTANGWRFSPNYYAQRDIAGMWYMVE